MTIMQHKTHKSGSDMMIIGIDQGWATYDPQGSKRGKIWMNIMYTFARVLGAACNKIKTRLQLIKLIFPTSTSTWLYF